MRRLCFGPLSGAECSLTLAPHKGNTNCAPKGFKIAVLSGYGLISEVNRY